MLERVVVVSTQVKNKELNDRLKLVRTELEYTQTDFAKRLGFSQGGYARLETGWSNVTDRVILQICHEFNVNETWLRTGQGSMFMETEGELVQKLADRYHLDATSIDALHGFLSLSNEERQAILLAAHRMADAARRDADGQKEKERRRKEARAEAHRRLDAELDAREQKQEDLQTTYIVSLDRQNEPTDKA